MEVIGIKKTDQRYDVWRLTFDGTVLGDSRRYSRDRAIEEARKVVARDPENRELDSTL